MCSITIVSNGNVLADLYVWVYEQYNMLSFVHTYMDIPDQVM